MIDPVFECFLRETACRDEDLVAVRKALVEAGVLSGSKDLLALTREVTAARSTDLRLRLPRPETASRRPQAILLAGAALAMAAAAALWTTHEPPVTEPVALAQSLQAEASHVELTPSSAVSLGFQGKGELGGTEQAPRIRWERGTLDVEVTPNQGIDLQVETREAQIRVVGTGFTVERGALGTRVVVRHGRVEVVCTGDEPVLVGAGEERTCGPTSSAGQLARARALLAAKAQPELVFAAVDAGLALAEAGSPVASELRVVRIQALADGGRLEEALGEVDAYLADPAAMREAQVRRLGAEMALSLQDCERARGYGLTDAEFSLAACGKSEDNTVHEP